mmetsp:Transcript_154988/g.496763  ORF Transcript_154988/g.496763 Transcript_154988/m.496763 type:complete len:364 (+) Transcript_154988:5264-6355(+)
MQRQFGEHASLCPKVQIVDADLLLRVASSVSATTHQKDLPEAPLADELHLLVATLTIGIPAAGADLRAEGALVVAESVAHHGASDGLDAKRLRDVAAGALLEGSRERLPREALLAEHDDRDLRLPKAARSPRQLGPNLFVRINVVFLIAKITAAHGLLHGLQCGARQFQVTEDQAHPSRTLWVRPPKTPHRAGRLQQVAHGLGAAALGDAAAAEQAEHLHERAAHLVVRADDQDADVQAAPGVLNEGLRVRVELRGVAVAPGGRVARCLRARTRECLHMQAQPRRGLLCHGAIGTALAASVGRLLHLLGEGAEGSPEATGTAAAGHEDAGGAAETGGALGVRGALACGCNFQLVRGPSAAPKV